MSSNAVRSMSSAQSSRIIHHPVAAVTPDLRIARYQTCEILLEERQGSASAVSSLDPHPTLIATVARV